MTRNSEATRRRVFAAFVALAASLFASEAAAQFVTNFIECPAWSTARSQYLGTAEHAVMANGESLAAQMELGAACVPFRSISCTGSGASRACTAVQKQGCSQTPMSIPAEGSGLPGDSIITAGNPNDGNKSWCAKLMPQGSTWARTAAGAATIHRIAARATASRATR